MRFSNNSNSVFTEDILLYTDISFKKLLYNNSSGLPSLNNCLYFLHTVYTPYLEDALFKMLSTTLSKHMIFLIISNVIFLLIIKYYFSLYIIYFRYPEKNVFFVFYNYHKINKLALSSQTPLSL